MTGRRSPTLVKYLGRGFATLLLASLAAGAAYFAIDATLAPGKRADLQNQGAITATANQSQKNQLAPAPRAAGVLDGLFGFAAIVAVTLLVAVIGRYVLRLRL